MRIAMLACLTLLGPGQGWSGGSPPSFTTPAAYLAAIQAGRAHGEVHGLGGRILRGRKDVDFENLSEDPQRRIVFALGEDGLEKLLGLSGAEMLLEIGYTEDYIQHLRARGTRFRLLVFPRSSELVQATWEGVAALVAQAYPELGDLVEKTLPSLSSRSFSQLEAESPRPWAEADRAGRTHPDFWTAERLLRSDRSAWKVRAFLYHELHLTELYSGDGWTLTHQGRRGLREFLMQNSPVESLAGAKFLELEL